MDQYIFFYCLRQKNLKEFCFMLLNAFIIIDLHAGLLG